MSSLRYKSVNQKDKQFLTVNKTIILITFVFILVSKCHLICKCIFVQDCVICQSHYINILFLVDTRDLIQKLDYSKKYFLFLFVIYYISYFIIYCIFTFILYIDVVFVIKIICSYQQ